MAEYSVDLNKLDEIKNNYFTIIDKIIESSDGRKITLVAAAKTVDDNILNYSFHSLGITNFGENKVQEYLSKINFYSEPAVNFHFIGKLQRNKIKYIIDNVSLIHSLDNIDLAADINKYACRINKVVDCLIEVNIGNESSKSGINTDSVIDFAYDVNSFDYLKIKGIMIIPPKCEVLDKYNYYYEKGYSIFDSLISKNIISSEFPILSMGMSDSYDLAIKHGSNMVRIGTALFGKRNYNN